MGEDTDTAGMLRSMGDALLEAGDLVVISGDLVSDLALRAMVGLGSGLGLVSKVRVLG